jgi:hypothetical protein
MPRVGFEPTTPVFQRENTVQALGRAVTVIGLSAFIWLLFFNRSNLSCWEFVDTCSMLYSSWYSHIQALFQILLINAWTYIITSQKCVLHRRSNTSIQFWDKSLLRYNTKTNSASCILYSTKVSTQLHALFSWSLEKVHQCPLSRKFVGSQRWSEQSSFKDNLLLQLGIKLRPSSLQQLSRTWNKDHISEYVIEQWIK